MDVAKMLIKEYGFEMDIVDCDGKTALDYIEDTKKVSSAQRRYHPGVISEEVFVFSSQ